jgi:multidrug resistance efflux pump
VAARTAVVAGTATAVSGKVHQGQQAKAQQAADAEAQQQQEAAAQAAATEAQAPPPPPPPPPPAPVPAADDVLDSLERLAALHAQGILTDEELAQQKARILGG